MREQALIILKPDAVTRGLLGEVMTRLERTGLTLVGCKMHVLSTEVLKEHYAQHVEKPFFPDILSYMQASPALLQVWEGVDACAIIRKIVGKTDPAVADPGTIRGDFAVSIARNIIHASEDADAGQVEVPRFFGSDEIFTTYQRTDEVMIYGKNR
jgi:nucleoside-diphosphate kinase